MLNQPDKQILTNTMENKIKDTLQMYLEGQSQDDKFSGSVLVARNGEPIFVFSSGLANRERNVPNGIDTKFNLGSANKMFTGVAIGQLVEKGTLKIDDTVGNILPSYPNKTVRDNVTIHHLLTHTSGLGSFIDIAYRQELLNVRSKLMTIERVVNLFKNRPLSFPVGELHYSSDGYELLGLIIEKISGQSYYDYVRQHIFEVANMPNTDSYEIDPNNPRTDIAIGYTNRDPMTNKFVEGERQNNLNVNLLKGTAGGSGYSTCHDLLNFTKALIGNELMDEQTTRLFMSPKIKEGSKDGQTKYEAYGFQVFDINGVLRIGHPGRFSGVNTRIDMYPQSGYTVIVLANYDPPSAFDVAEKAGELIIQKILGYAE